MSKSILIAGAGISGLTCALALARYGIKSTLIEAFEKPQEVGAGIQVPPNSWRILDALGLNDPLNKAAIKPTAIQLADAHTAKIALDLPVNTDPDADMHFGVIHRARLHNILWEAAQDSDLITIHTGQTIDEVHESSEHITVTCRSGDDKAEYHADILIGADGIWSNVRRYVPGAKQPKATGRIALRAIVPASKTAPEPVVTAWMAPKSHVVTYPVRNNDTLNVVAIIRGAAHNARWDSHFDGRLPLDLSDTLNRISSAEADRIEFTRWPLFAVKPGGKWHSKRICLIGDAAHGMEPFAAQGAAMGIEDGFELAFYLKGIDQAQPHKIFTDYAMGRARRVAKVAKRTELNRIAYHQWGLGRWGRNFLFAAQPSEKFLDSLNWLYKYRAKGL